MILPKAREPPFVTIRRGGTLAIRITGPTRTRWRFLFGGGCAMSAEAGPGGIR